MISAAAVVCDTGRPSDRSRQACAAALLVVVLLAAACSSDGSENVPAGDDAPSSETAAVAPATDTDRGEAQGDLGVRPAPLPGDDRQLPVDDGVRRGSLSNGLTYLLRANDSPGSRAELRLVVRAGSADEAADQSGVAHFLEHMMFNGTERYPANELVAVLESFGNEFGPDVNAYTNFTETVYQLSIPTDDREVIEEAFTVLAEWAGHATIDPVEVENERGVIEEEWRERSQGVGGRISSFYAELLTEGTDFADRLPIGDMEAIRTMTEGPLRRFYETWYTPSNMAVVVVGDFDLDLVEALIEDRFGGFADPDVPGTRYDLATVVGRPAAEPPRVSRLDDPDLPNAYVEIIWPGRAEPPSTVGDLRRAAALDLAAAIIDARFADDVTRGDTPFLSAYSSTTPLVRDIDTPGLLAEGAAEDLGASFESLLIEIERIRRDGFTDEEFERALAAARSAADQELAGADTIQDSAHAAAIVEHVTGGAPLLAVGDSYDLLGEIFDTMTAERVAAEFLAVVDERGAEVVVVGPEDDTDALPDEAFLLDAWERIPDGPISSRDDDSSTVSSLLDPPDPADVTSERTITELDATVIELANGVTVAIRPTTIARNSFGLEGIGPGGRSVLDEADLAASFLAPDVVTASGVGDLDQVSLERFLSDRVVSLRFGLQETRALVQGEAATEDAEVVFALLHQYLTEARTTDAALETALRELEPFVEDPSALPGLATAAALTELRFGGDERFAVLPSPDDLASLDAAGVERVFAQSFADVDGWVFTIVGDIEPERARDLAQRYLGTLPSDGATDAWQDRQPAPPEGIVERTVEAGSDPQGSVSMLVSAEAEADPADEIALEVLRVVLSGRLRDGLREDLGATYSPVVTIAASHEPDELVETTIQVGGDPADLDPIVGGIVATLGDLAGGGITEDEFSSAATSVRRDLELVTNAFWSRRIADALIRPEVEVLSVNDTLTIVGALSVDDLNDLARRVLSDEQYVLVRTVPASG